jgi:hypothetical protein
MKRQHSGEVFPPIPERWHMPFYYASLSSLKIYYAVDAAALGPYLGGTGLKHARFKDAPGQGVVSVEFQNYTGHGGVVLETCNEVEFNILAYPKSREAQVPLMPLLEFIKGLDQTKTIGGFRVYVPCDNPIAIDAGRQVFGEPKFKTTFSYKLPSLNLPKQKTWEYTVYDPEYDPSMGKPKQKDIVYEVTAHLTGMTPEHDGNPSAIVLYSMFPELPDGGLAGSNGYRSGRLIGSLWNIFDVDLVYWLCDKGQKQKKVSLTPGESGHSMRADMEAIIGSAPPVCVQVYQSDPAAVENRAYYVDV